MTACLLARLLCLGEGKKKKKGMDVVYSIKVARARFASSYSFFLSSKH